MTRNLKALGLALLAICALGAVAAQGASAATVHKFHGEAKHIVVTGKAVEGNHTFKVGEAGTVECTGAEFTSTQAGTEVSAKTFSSDTMTVVPHYTGCTFGGQPATVKFTHCAYVFEGETTLGNPTGGEHANVKIECSGGSEVEIDTSLCTITVAAGQEIKDAVRYENITESSVKIKATAHKVKTGKKKTTESQTGCLLFPTGEVGTYTGVATAECFKDEGETVEGTEKTTSALKKGATAKCTVKGA
jgi:hypothetical protein